MTADERHLTADAIPPRRGRVVGATLLALAFCAPAHALSVKNLACEVPGLGRASFITSFGARYVLFDWWALTGEAAGTHSVNFADCTGGRMIRATSPEGSDRLGQATDLLFTAARSDTVYTMDGLTAALTGAGFQVQMMSLPEGHCACAADMMQAAGQ
jgi:hypothetical protein